MANGDRPEAASPEDVEIDEDEKAPEKKTASNVGSIETEKVTDFAEEKETQVDERTLKETMASLNKVAQEESAARQKWLAEREKIQVKEADVHLVEKEMDLSYDDAEKALKDHNGDLIATLRALTA